MRIFDSTDRTCHTKDCIHWCDGVCRFPALITILNRCCYEYESISSESLHTRKFATSERMAEIANNAVDSFRELLSGRSLYDALSGALKMSDTEILAAGFTTLREFMKGSEVGEDV